MLPKSNLMTTLMEHLGIYHDGGEEYMFCNQDMLDATCSMLALPVAKHSHNWYESCDPHGGPRSNSLAILHSSS